MPKWKTGDRVKVVSRDVTKEDRTTNSYYSHLGGLTGTVTNFYNKDEVAVRVDPEAFTPTIAVAHKEAVKRMRLKFIINISEDQKRKLTKEEKQFDANYVLLLHSDDLEKGPPAPKKVAKKIEEDDEEIENFDPTSVREDIIYDNPEIPGLDISTRKSLAEIEAEEEAELKRRKN